MIKGKPFVKWAGGKRSIIDKWIQLSPNEFNTYYEPFVGGGAMLLLTFIFFLDGTLNSFLLLTLYNPLKHALFK